MRLKHTIRRVVHVKTIIAKRGRICYLLQVGSSELPQHGSEACPSKFRPKKATVARRLQSQRVARVVKKDNTRARRRCQPSTQTFGRGTKRNFSVEYANCAEAIPKAGSPHFFMASHQSSARSRPAPRCLPSHRRNGVPRFQPKAR